MAAISALKDSGCDAPKGMKIVVSFVQDGDKKWNKKKNNQRDGGGNGNGRKNQNNHIKNNRKLSIKLFLIAKLYNYTCLLIALSFVAH